MYPVDLRLTRVGNLQTLDAHTSPAAHIVEELDVVDGLLQAASVTGSLNCYICRYAVSCTHTFPANLGVSAMKWRTPRPSAFWGVCLRNAVSHKVCGRDGWLP